MVLEKWLLDGPRVIDVELVRSVKVSLIGGQVDILAHDEPGARIEVHSVVGRELKVSIDGDRLEVDHPQLRWDNFIDVFKSWRGNARADVSILVPRDAALKFGVISASALVSGLTSDARISTITGDVVLDSLEGDIEVNSVSGEVSVRDHVGRISAHTVSGDIAASGRISRFSSDGVSGSVFVDLSGHPYELQNNTVSGDLTVRVDDGLPMRYNINTVSGTLQLGGSTIKGLRGSGYNGSTGTLEGEWLDVKANSVSGSITVLSRPAAADETSSGESTGGSSTGSSGGADSDSDSATSDASTEGASL
ncbi:hypothetical protein GCM10010988_10280 [Cnuibacter physcomitrellae]|uniref:DUF4097 domain-containing protein n=1 Tax=Cnuibacter physcomitrellae TaxID=1619308 RepID=A0A1X9LPJ6_9MICO|nr:hypothetical protein [Cnuibacter physcomitrellae]ARJ05881.1 hypothetical protein B5808_12080 [Cnuibacter physcomitrellae]GGI36704.1 hypothetical protein GCM10010988_10280 [Cnuibacter physcomitrellae]